MFNASNRAEIISLLKEMDGAAERAVKALRGFDEVPPSAERLGSARTLEQMQRLLHKIDLNGHLEHFKADVGEGDSAQLGYRAFARAKHVVNAKKRRKRKRTDNVADGAASAGVAATAATTEVASTVADDAASAGVAGRAATTELVGAAAEGAAKAGVAGDAASTEVPS